LGSTGAKTACRTLMKLTPGRAIVCRIALAIACVITRAMPVFTPAIAGF